ncbi:hypothetical protein JL720_13041 [Aureococcus anophagefferens]|nr:hypothetical protein JL720_13041 [Aureococcus anophagefferens]
MDPTCVYDHTPDLVKRSRLLRALLAYDEPLTIRRVLGALSVGAIPSSTRRARTAASAKGCDDPARFWRDGGGGFDRGAPFVFVKDWDNLAEALEGRRGRRRRLETRADLDAYRAALEDHLRAVLLARPPAKTRTACAAAPLSAADGATSSRPSPPTAGLVRRPRRLARRAGRDLRHDPAHGDGGVDLGMLCFDAACAPPSVAAFECRGAYGGFGPRPRRAREAPRGGPARAAAAAASAVGAAGVDVLLRARGAAAAATFAKKSNFIQAMDDDLPLGPPPEQRPPPEHGTLAAFAAAMAGGGRGAARHGRGVKVRDDTLLPPPAGAKYCWPSPSSMGRRP